MPKKIDYTGQRFGRLTVVCKVKMREQGRGTHYLCLCDCGYNCIVSAHCLKQGFTKSCGCLHTETLQNVNHNVSATGYRGVSRDKDGKYHAQLTCRKEVYYLGRYDTPQEAHEAYESKRAELKATSHSGGGTGVTYDKKRQKWCAQICIHANRYNLGRYDTEEEAKKARAIAEEALRQGTFEKFWQGWKEYVEANKN